MGRLQGRALPSRIARKPRVAVVVPVRRAPWRKWYSTARWSRLRMDVLQSAKFTCQRPGCGRIEADTSKLVADHIRPHRGDPDLFWDRRNLQCLCWSCHSRDKQRDEAAQ